MVNSYSTKKEVKSAFDFFLAAKPFLKLLRYG
jgi:hypothetical protein